MAAVVALAMVCGVGPGADVMIGDAHDASREVRVRGLPVFGHGPNGRRNLAELDEMARRRRRRRR